MSSELVGALLRELLNDPEAVAALRRALDSEEDDTPSVPAYTVTTLSDRVGLSEKAIRNAITRGELQARKRSGRWMIRAEEVQAWLGSPEVVPARQTRRSRRIGPLGGAFDGLGGAR